MIDLTFDISDKDRKSATLEYLIQIIATQRATALVMMEMLKVNNEDRDLHEKLFEESIKVFADKLYEELYEKMGITDLNKILKPE